MTLATTGLVIGIDLDNTLIDYDGAFAEVGSQLGLLPLELHAGSKAAVKDFLATQTDGETTWMRLQGQVYGRYIALARLYAGVPQFLAAADVADATLFVVSHKTQYGHFDESRTDLRVAAQEWLARNGVFDGRFGRAIAPSNVFFEATRESKLRRISALGCDVFIDDLSEVLADPLFPSATRPILFCPAAKNAATVPDGFPDWPSIARAVFGQTSPRQEQQCHPLKIPG